MRTIRNPSGRTRQKRTTTAATPRSKARVPGRKNRPLTDAIRPVRKSHTVGGASGQETRVPTGTHLPQTYQRKGYTSDRDPSTNIYDRERHSLQRLEYGQRRVAPSARCERWRSPLGATLVVGAPARRLTATGIGREAAFRRSGAQFSSCAKNIRRKLRRGVHGARLLRSGCGRGSRVSVESA